MTTLHGNARNYFPYFYYIFLGRNTEAYMYVLSVKDYFSGDFWLSPPPSSTAEHTATTLVRFTRTFTAPEFWVSDQGSHFIDHTLV